MGTAEMLSANLPISYTYRLPMELMIAHAVPAGWLTIWSIFIINYLYRPPMKPMSQIHDQPESWQPEVSSLSATHTDYKTFKLGVCHDRDNSQLMLSQAYAKPRQVHTDGCEWMQLSQQSPSTWVSNTSMLATSFPFAKSVSPLCLPYLDTPLFLHHFSIHVSVYLTSVGPYYLYLDFLIPGPTIPQSHICKYLLICSFALMYCMWLTYLLGHHLIGLITYITCGYFSCSL